MQLVNFKEEDNLPSALQSGRASRTMLTEYFATNKENTSARQWVYFEFPENYVWNVQDRYWKPRQRSGTIGRIVSANPSEGERYFLRILITHIRGGTSFINLYTIDGQICSSFKEAAGKRCLLEKDNATEECRVEASVF
ncbi:uncharacterized protein LOC114310811 [Camellia sinensis]|uniref:uncharacterized protein LOC114310811 n=1 Tax=Camellia sinensis TaxID=4442 RepID=UPI0010357F7C|nr:uncharacterized protein LOC114310811 [Camellia sinensis]